MTRFKPLGTDRNNRFGDHPNLRRDLGGYPPPSTQRYPRAVTWRPVRGPMRSSNCRIGAYRINHDATLGYPPLEAVALNRKKVRERG